MENEKDMKTEEKETREFLEGLAPAELRRLLDTPVFRGTVLEHAAESERLSQSVDQALDLEFREMTPERQERIKRLAAKLAQKYAPALAVQEGWLTRQWRIIAAGARQFAGAEPALVMGAHQKSEPGWPFVLSLEGGGQTETRVQFDLWGVDLVVSNASGVGGSTILIEVKSSGKKTSLQPGEKQSLGDIEEFHLTDTSNKDEIAKALEASMEVRPQLF